jgi:hypothetical protein
VVHERLLGRTFTALRCTAWKIPSPQCFDSHRV